MNTCVDCGAEGVDVDENGECFDCADVDEPDLDTEHTCHECGIGVGPYDGVCLDCLDVLDQGCDDDEDTPW